MKFLISNLTKTNIRTTFATVLPTLLLFFILSTSSLWAGNNSFKFSKRIISTSPAITETLFALGLGHRVVGVTDFCQYPPEACQISSIGGINPNMEILVSLRPDLVVHQYHSTRMTKKTKTLGIPAMGITMNTLGEILNSIDYLGSSLGVEKESDQLLKKLTVGINYYKNKLKGIPQKEVLLILGDSSDPVRDLYSTGPGTFLHELLEISGGKNILPKTMAKYPRLTKEYIIEMSPEVIIEAGPKSRLTPEQVQKRLSDWKRFPSIRAVQNNKIHYISANYILIPGPRFMNTLEKFSKAIHPKIFQKSLNLKHTKEEFLP